MTAIESINQTINQLRQLTEIDIQNRWHYDTYDGEIAPINEKKYITWDGGSQTKYLVQKIIIPETLQGYPLTGLSLRLVLTWWAESTQIFVNGNLIQEGDLFDSSTRLLLTLSAIPQQEFIVTLCLISPNHDLGALMRSKLIYEQAYTQNNFVIDPSFVADELTILSQYLASFAPQELDSVATEVNQINWQLVNHQQAFNNELLKLRDRLLKYSPQIKQNCLHLLGHAHLDLAWLWTVQETWKVAENTFNSVLNLQKDYPELTFCHSTPALYEWIEINRPDIFIKIKKAVENKQWEILGGMWVEPEVNLISGESLIRQFLYGQTYIKNKFGTITKIAWLPDSFGFPWQFPQICQQSGIEYFVTNKLHWNDTNKFTHGFFDWQGLDGTKLLTLISPPNVTGVMDTNPLTMSNYSRDWQKQTQLTDVFWLPGIGDHGGGPTKDMIEVGKRWQNSPFIPQLKFTQAINYLELVKNQTKNNLPIWNDELYLEFHRGCYTTHGDQKYFNRRAENLLYQAELFASLASIINNQPHNQEIIEKTWKQVLFNQFHDILPGTSIPEVFIEANQQWQTAITTAQEILNESLKVIASRINLPSPIYNKAKALIIFNPLNWQRSEVVKINIPDKNWTIYDLEGKEITCQLSHEKQLLFLAQDIPSIGYSFYWLSPQVTEIKNQETPSEFILENEHLKVTIHLETGEISSIFVKSLNQEILEGRGNQLQAFQDKGQYWDAWNIDPNYQDYPLPDSQLISIQWLEYGVIRQTIRVIRQLGKSEFIQDYILDNYSEILKIFNTIDWQESQVLVKAVFPFQLESDYATYEIGCGAIQRPTNPQNQPDKAKWEVYGHYWADLTDKQGNYGVSLLNDCKYGYDTKPHQIRLTLLRSPQWPDSTADRGKHQFTYAIYPHLNSWEKAKTVHRGYELNMALIPFVKSIDQLTSEKSLPPRLSLINIAEDNIILMALKRGEKEGYILRFYECHGATTNITFNNGLNMAIAANLDCLETPISNQVNLTLNPWQIVTYQLKNCD